MVKQGGRVRYGLLKGHSCEKLREKRATNAYKTTPLIVWSYSRLPCRIAKILLKGTLILY